MRAQHNLKSLFLAALLILVLMWMAWCIKGYGLTGVCHVLGLQGRFILLPAMVIQIIYAAVLLIRGIAGRHFTEISLHGFGASSLAVPMIVVGGVGAWFALYATSFNYGDFRKISVIGIALIVVSVIQVLYGLLLFVHGIRTLKQKK